MIITTPDGRQFDLVRIEPYIRKDGVATSLKVWQAPCVVCGEPFVVKTPMSTETYADTKSFGRLHCEDHKLSKEEVKNRWLKAIHANKDKQ